MLTPSTVLPPPGAIEIGSGWYCGIVGGGAGTLLPLLPVLLRFVPDSALASSSRLEADAVVAAVVVVAAVDGPLAAAAAATAAAAGAAAGGCGGGVLAVVAVVGVAGARNAFLPPPQVAVGPFVYVHVYRAIVKSVLPCCCVARGVAFLYRSIAIVWSVRWHPQCAYQLPIGSRLLQLLKVPVPRFACRPDLDGFS